ncbi:MAG: hypothetical protein M1837_004652 [Sclerophora amabilis]|nr:MAG: hypothetical protein M1837_004652 [Sclerophora amabilis]
MADNERTPLLQTVRIAPREPRYPHSTLRRFCTIALTTTLLAVLILFLIPVAFYPSPHWIDREGSHLLSYAPWASPFPHKSWPQSEGLPFDELQELLLSTPSEDKARQWSSYYTSGPHLAGKNLSQAIWTMDRWRDMGIADSKIVDYDIYVNYPKGHRLALLERGRTKRNVAEEGEDDRDKSTGGHWKVKYEASLEEDVLEEDKTSGLKDRIPTFHGYSASGNVTAPYVFVNYGTFQDYEDLLKANVSLEGTIALAKYGRIFRGLKVKRAQELGMVGAVMYTDPGDDGEATEEKGASAYPDGPAREPSSVQRGSTQFLSVNSGIAPGDPTTPGYPSKPGVPRQNANHSIPSIPSIPISYAEALPLLRALNGHGPAASSLPDAWHGGGLRYKGVEYNIGPSPPELALNLVNEQEYVTTPMWNVIGVINGSIPDEVVVLGNHRDAWIAGGAADPNSGSAALNEVVRSFGEALKKGWKPSRTIVFCSWDGEEYGLLGSTEWVEEYLPWLSKSAVAYLNVDVAASGSRFSTAASPLLNNIIYELTSLIPSPNQTVPGQTISSLWSKQIRSMGSGSDFTAFQDFAGIPCVDMGFGPGLEDPVYHYHSNYDSFDWMERFGDRGWHHHVAIAKLWSLFAAKLVETPIIGFNTTDYAEALAGYVTSVEDKLASAATVASKNDADNHTAFDIATISFSNLKDAVHDLKNVTSRFDAHAATVSGEVNRNLPWWKWWQKVKLYYEVRKVNSKYKYFERQFLRPEGLDGRPWFKHVVFAPGLWTGYAGATFPGLVESIDAEQWSNVQHRLLRMASERVDDMDYPHVVIDTIASFLSPPDLCSLLSTCRRLRHVKRWQKSDAWFDLCKRSRIFDNYHVFPLTWKRQLHRDCPPRSSRWYREEDTLTYKELIEQASEADKKLIRAERATEEIKNRAKFARRIDYRKKVLQVLNQDFPGCQQCLGLGLLRNYFFASVDPTSPNQRPTMRWRLCRSCDHALTFTSSELERRKLSYPIVRRHAIRVAILRHKGTDPVYLFWRPDVEELSDEVHELSVEEFGSFPETEDLLVALKMQQSRFVHNLRVEQDIIHWFEHGVVCSPIDHNRAVLAWLRHLMDHDHFTNAAKGRLDYHPAPFNCASPTNFINDEDRVDSDWAKEAVRQHARTMLSSAWGQHRAEILCKTVSQIILIRKEFSGSMVASVNHWCYKVALPAWFEGVSLSKPDETLDDVLFPLVQQRKLVEAVGCVVCVWDTLDTFRKYKLARHDLDELERNDIRILDTAADSPLHHSDGGDTVIGDDTDDHHHHHNHHEDDDDNTGHGHTPNWGVQTADGSFTPHMGLVDPESEGYENWPGSSPPSQDHHDVISDNEAKEEEEEAAPDVSEQQQPQQHQQEEDAIEEDGVVKSEAPAQHHHHHDNEQDEQGEPMDLS